MRNLLAATCLTPILIAGAAGAASADTTISASTSTPVKTSTVKAGAPDNVIIATGVALTPPSGAAITIDSNNSVTNNGTITINDKNDVTGIAASAGLAGTITNAGTITLGETTTDTTTTTNGGVDGPFAITTDKFGIHVAGSGTFTGSISSSGTMAIVGNNSAGIAVDGTLAGGVTTSGATTVTGLNAYGLHLHDVTGAVSVFGAVTTKGQNSTAIALDGNVGGLVAIENTITSTGYRSTTLPTDLTTLNADDLLQGGPAVSISGNVAGGVLLEVKPTASSTVPDNDGDGIADTSEGTAAVTNYGAAAALLVGSATQDITLGKVSGATAGLVIRGTVLGSGLYAGVNATGVQLGGLGHAVTITGGVQVTGTVQAVTNGGSATAILVGNGATMPVLTNSGTISATGNTGTAPTLHGIEIAAGANLPEIDNSGAIFASLAGTNTGTAAGIIDASGTLAKINNTGTIYGLLSNSADVSVTNGYALNLAANTTGITYTQSQSTVADATAPELAGRIVTGSGDDTFTVSAGTVAGNTNFGAGHDTLALSGSASWHGDTDFGTGAATATLAGTGSYVGGLTFGDGAAALTLSDTVLYNGLLTPGTGGLSIAVNGGKLALANAGTLALSAFSVGATGEIAVNVDPSAGTHTEYVVGGTAAFTSGAKLAVQFRNLLQADTTYTIVNAGTLTGGGNLAVDSSTIAFLYSGTLATGADGHSLELTVDRKTPAELGLNRTEGQAFNGIYAALGKNSNLTGAFLEITDQNTFVSTYRQLLPATSDGLFQSVMQGSREAARGATDPNALRVPIGAGPISFWLQEAAWHDNKARSGDSEGYDITGNGFTGGAETRLGDVGTVGLAGSYIVNNIGQRINGDKTFGYQYEGTAYWRGGFGPLQANAHASYATISLKNRRAFDSTFDGTAISFDNSDRWHGDLMTAGGGVDYRAGFGSFDITPTGALDYYRLHENGHGEDGDGATALTIASRTSNEFVGTGSLTLGYGLGREGSAAGWTRLELEGGWRQIIGGSLGDTTAHFAGGDDFTIGGDKLTSGYVGRIRAIGGNASLRLAGELSAEQLQKNTSIAGRVSVRLSF